MAEIAAHKGYLKGCQCGRCEKQREYAREYARTHKHQNPVARRAYKSAKQREYNAASRLAESPDAAERRRERDRVRSRVRYQKWREQNPRQSRQPAPQGSRRHGGADEWARLFDAQSGLCYLCLRPLPGDRSKVHVDHDHSCCDPGPKGRKTDSCKRCRRGLTHDKCNQIWGLANEDDELLRAIAVNGKRERGAAKQRIAGKPEQASLFVA